jgi:hypothetical protein
VTLTRASVVGRRSVLEIATPLDAALREVNRRTLELAVQWLDQATFS